MVSEKNDSDLVDKLIEQLKEDRRLSEKHHNEDLKEQKKQYPLSIAMLIIAIAAIVISITAYLDSSENTKMITKLQNIAQTQFNAQHFTLPQATGGDIFIENTFLPFFDSHEGITVSAVTNDNLQFEVTNATLLYAPSFSKCFFSQSPTVSLIGPEYTILKSNEQNAKVVPMLRMDFRVNGTFIGGNQTGKLIQAVVGTIQYDMIATNLGTNQTYALKAYSSLIASIPLNNFQYIERC